jgi:hypothetical protein
VRACGAGLKLSRAETTLVRFAGLFAATITSSLDAPVDLYFIVPTWCLSSISVDQSPIQAREGHDDIP